MKTKSNKNALVHGVYSSDVVLPWERAEDFNELLNGIRRDLMPAGTIEDDTVFEIAVLQWKKRRLLRLQQLAFLQSPLAADIEKSGKRSVTGINRFLKMERTQEGQFPAAIVSLCQSTTELAGLAKNKKKPWKGKLGANLRGVINDIEALRPHIEADVKALAEEKPQAEENISGSAYTLDVIGPAHEMEERLDAMIEKKMRRLAGIKEYQRLYGPDSGAGLIENRAATARDVSPIPPVKKSFGSAAMRMARLKKAKRAEEKINDENNNNNYDNDNDDDYDNNGPDWEHECDQAMAEKKARRERKGER